jgi:hypothetical protein
MKKFALFILVVLPILKSYSQEGYMVTFSGEGDTTGLTMVQVINMTQGDTAYLNGQDTLHLNPFTVDYFRRSAFMGQGFIKRTNLVP